MYIMLLNLLHKLKC